MEENDSRILCKYGTKCYQKNTYHKRKYKHTESDVGDNVEPPRKKEKLEEAVSPQKTFKNVEPLGKEEEIEKAGSPEKRIIEKDEEKPLSPLSDQEFIKEKFLVEMPKDFYDLWKHCLDINPKNPEDTFKCVGLTLVGPFDILSGKMEKRDLSPATFLCHWRYYYDPPEFQTVIAGKEDEYHIGYYRDTPWDLPVFVAAMSNSKPGSISAVGENLFSALVSFLDSCLKSCDVFSRNEIQKLLKSTQKFSEENNYSLDASTSGMKSRGKKVVSKTFHGAGIVVPVCKETEVGYREIPETTACLKKMFKKIRDSSDVTRETNFEALHELMTQVQFANDEGDFGMGLELAIDLFTFGGEEFHSAISHLLTVSYELLNRNSYTEIVKAHLADRRKGGEMSRFY